MCEFTEFPVVKLTQNQKVYIKPFFETLEKSEVQFQSRYNYDVVMHLDVSSHDDI